MKYYLKLSKIDARYCKITTFKKTSRHYNRMATDNSKTIAILSYITLIGWIIALVMHQSNKTKLGGFHIRQTLLLWIAGIILNFIPFVGLALSVVVVVFWVIGLVSAVKGEMKPLPLIGDLAQTWFKGI